MARRHVRWGRWLVYRRLRIEGSTVDHNRVQRIWREEGLQRPLPRRCKRSRPADGSRELLRAEYPHHVWAIDFQFDQTMDGRRLKFLNVVDEYSRVCLAIRVGRRCKAVCPVSIRLTGAGGVNLVDTGHSGARRLCDAAVDDQGMAVVHAAHGPGSWAVLDVLWISGTAARRDPCRSGGSCCSSLMPRKSPLARFLPSVKRHPLLVLRRHENWPTWGRGGGRLAALLGPVLHRCSPLWCWLPGTRALDRDALLRPPPRLSVAVGHRQPGRRSRPSADGADRCAASP